MPGLNDSPFAVLTAVVAPAILTNACSVLSLGTANRIARVVDRTRVVIAARAPLATDSAEYRAYSRQLDQLQTRGMFLRRALRMFYASLGAFAASALTAVAGSVLAAYDLQIAFRAAAVIGLGIGTGGVSALVFGCAMMVRETRLAIQSMTEEVALAQTHKPD
jgi:hypothetical protein